MTNNNTDQLPESPLPAEDTEGDFDGQGEGSSFTIVVVGASAEAFTQLLKALPVDTGMASVLVRYLAPTHASAPAETLSRAMRPERLTCLALKPKKLIE